MSYKALYRSYRPNNFNEVVGQDHITSTLKNIISNQKIGHAYLFAGPRGTGKTSVAHVFARAVNANAAGEEVFGEMDILEIDAASNNGVAEVRNIIDNVGYAPTKAKYKVYIIDEVHMLTKGAFNALLKTLEEPPAHVIFILATTEPHKIPITILSRTQRFNFRRIDDVTISEQLKSVLQKENIQYDEESIKFISKLAQGGMRDALSIADQSSAFGNGVLSFEAISQVFGIISIENQIKLFNLAYSGEAKELMHLASKLLDNGADIERLSSSLLDILKDYIVFKKTSDASLLSFITKEEVESLKLDITYAYDAVDNLIKLVGDLRFTSVPRQSFELSILKLVNKSSSQSIVEEITKEVVKEEPVVKEEEVVLKLFEDDNTTKISVETKEILEPTKEINLDVVQEEQEEMIEQAQVEDDILSTQEIPVGEINDTEETGDMDIMRLFETDNFMPSKPKQAKNAYSVNEILNLFVQANRDEISNAKMKLASASEYRDSKYRHFAEQIMASKVISAGKNFILVSAEDQHIIDGINSEVDNEDFIKFINALYGQPMRVFAISKKEFEIVKEEWSRSASTNSLPHPRPIVAPTLKVEKKTQAEELGTELFGELFSF